MIKKLISSLIITIYIIIIIFVFLSSFTVDIKRNVILLLISILIIFLISKKSNQNNKIFYFIIAIGLLLRITLLMFSYNDVQSDEATYFYNAQNFAQNKDLASRYISIFPHLMSYIALLGFTMKIFGTSFYVAVGLNIFIDLLGAYFAYLLGRKLFKENGGIILSSIWLLNPFNIIWCIKALPIVTVNTCFVILMYIFVCTLENKKQFIPLSILLGIFLGISNYFRPIFIIFLIAFFLYSVYEIFILKEDKKYAITTFLITTLTFIGTNNITASYTNHCINEKIATKAAGWNIYVGSNYETSGQWFAEPKLGQFMALPDNEFSAQNIHNYFLKEGINNYKEYGIRKSLDLFQKKFTILTKDVPDYSANIFNTSIKNFNINISYILNIFWFILIISNIIVFHKVKEIPNVIRFTLVLQIGLIISSLFVEVSPRYFLPETVPLIIILAYWIKEKKPKKT